VEWPGARFVPPAPMKKLLHLALLPVALSGTARAQTGTGIETRVVQAGETRQLSFLTALNPDCSADSEMTARISKQPAHGAAQIERGVGYASYGKNDQRFSCNRSLAEGYNVNYTPQADFVGDDQFEVEIFSPQGRYRLWKYLVTVK